MLSFLFTLMLSTNAAEPVCLEGFYDLGEQAAAMGFVCNTDTQAEIFFCKRDVLLNKGECTGQMWTVYCEWQDLENNWKCEDPADGFFASVTKISDTRISYKFKSKFNGGDLTGTLIP